MTKPVLLIMAAGMGSRYGGLKQLDPVGENNQMIIDYSIYDARRAGFERVVFVIKREIEAGFKALVGDRVAREMEVSYVFQEKEDLPAGYAVPADRTKPWGTAQAVLAARHVVDGPFAVINADDYYGPEAFRVIYDYLAHHRDRPDCFQYAMVGYHLGKTVTEHGGVTRGICHLSQDGLLEEVEERAGIEKDGDGGRYAAQDGSWVHLDGKTLVSMNFWGFQRSFLDEAMARFPLFLDRILDQDPIRGECYLPILVTDMLSRGRAQVRMLSTADKWYGVTYREDKPAVVEALREKTEQGLYPENLWGV